MRASRGEILIEEILQEAGFVFKEEYVFPDLKSTSGRPLRFDFAVFKNQKLSHLIEYNGEQHYKPIKHFGGQLRFEKQQRRDSFIQKYCQENNIKLIVIKY